ncbi:AAA family ATPase [Lentisalinibacter orientalis]|jgi:type II secretory pathway predicted ATPase ExeA/pSer/pThr/pTyr-binding forkhead associated (FHA) protein|uniref:AAA family ATPase n=1 Tax=Lentisalinibacter orientalis TaxID=2992241 RepID=UPI0038635295
MSYLEHFKLAEQPFRLTPDPAFVYWSKQHARAKAYMESTIWLADGFVVITGEIGSGKTTLIQSFLNELGDDVVYAMVSQTQLSPSQFLQAVLAEFGFKPFQARKAELLDMLNMFLVEQYGEGKKVVLIIDEAQNLSPKVLEEIRLLSGIETHKEKVLRIILAGQPELKDKIESPRLKQLTQRVRLRFHLGPLTNREMREYIGHRLKVAGADAEEIFAEDCLDLIYRRTGGVPRLINTLCDTAMLCAFAEEQTLITPEIIETALEELAWEVEAPAAEPTEHAEPGNTGQILRPVSLDPRDTGEMTLARIDVRLQGKVVETHNLEVGRTVIGRTPDNEIRIDSKYVSRHHCQIVSDLERSVLEDLNSTNGVFLGKHRIKKKSLEDGDVIVLGKHELVYTDLRDAELEEDEEADEDELAEAAEEAEDEDDDDEEDEDLYAT